VGKEEKRRGKPVNPAERWGLRRGGLGGGNSGLAPFRPTLERLGTTEDTISPLFPRCKTSLESNGDPPGGQTQKLFHMTWAYKGGPVPWGTTCIGEKNLPHVKTRIGKFHKLAPSTPIHQHR